MKTPMGTQTELRNLLDLLIVSEVAILAKPVTNQALPNGRSRITWVPNKTIKHPNFQHEFGSINEYIHWIQSESYTAILYDGAIIQVSFDFDGHDLVAHRLAYYPCPFVLDTDLLREEPLLDVIELYKKLDINYLRLKSPLRFDFDVDAGAPGHPASHLTMQSSECRWPVVAPLSLGHFEKFIFKHFYPRVWSLFDFLRQWPQELGNRSISEDEKRALHIACIR